METLPFNILNDNAFTDLSSTLQGLKSLDTPQIPGALAGLAGKFCFAAEILKSDHASLVVP